jgi:hypothetical protein
VSAGRTIWWPKDTAWWRREWIVDLGEEFGSAGPSVIDWLSCEAKVQDDGGRVRTGVKSVARGSFVDLVTVGHVLSQAVTIGLLEDFEGGVGRFECRISGWTADNERGSATLRKRKQRDGESRSTEPDSPDSASVTRRDMSRTVTSGHLREEKRRVKKGESHDSPRDDLLGLSKRMADGMKANDPKAKVAPESSAWLEPLRLLVDRDSRTCEEVERVIDWIATDDFERTVVLSPAKLRKRFTDLVAKMQRDGQWEIPTAGPLSFRRERRPLAAAEEPTEFGAPPLELLAEWEPVRDKLLAAAPSSGLALTPLHPHAMEGDTVILGCPRGQARWLSERFGRLISETAGRPIRIVECRCEPEAAAA